MRIWIPQGEIGASGLDVCENVCCADEGSSVYALCFLANVDTEGLDSHRHRSQEVLPSRRLAARCCIEVVVFSVTFGVCVGLAALSQWMLRGFRRVSTVYVQHLPQKVLVKCSFCLGW